MTPDPGLAGRRDSEKSAIQLSRSGPVLEAARVTCKVRIVSHCTHKTIAAFASIIARSTEPTDISIRLLADVVIAADISRTIVVKLRIGRFIRLRTQLQNHR
jgi:hypothetical protein